MRFILACKHKPKDPLNRGFYFWQTNYNFNSIPHDSIWADMQIGKLYLRCFDISWDQDAKAPVKKGKLVEFPGRLVTKEIIPVVFIGNKVFQQLKLEEIDHMATMSYLHLRQSITDLIKVEEHRYYEDFDHNENTPYRQKSKDFGELDQKEREFKKQYDDTIKEIQFDCDWTETSKDKYFTFLKKMKQLFAGKTISCTIRLYPFKYPQTAGVPPVDRGMLMCYNSGDIKDIKTVNSIFNKREVLSYLDGKEYPLPLDAVLPVFSWALLYRGNKLENILSIDELQGYYKEYLKKTGEKLVATKDFTYGDNHHSIYIREGDIIKYEETDMELVEAILPELKTKLGPGSTLAFYHVTKHAFDKHAEQIRKIFNSF